MESLPPGSLQYQEESKTMFSSFQTVERVVYGRGVAAKLGDEALRLGCRTVAVITDKGLVDAGIHTPLMASLKGAGVEALLYDQAELDPTPGVH